MHAASRLASHRSFKLIVRFPGTDDPDVPVINVAQLQTHTQEEVSSSTSFPHPTLKTLRPDLRLTLPQHTISMDIITHRLFCFEQGNTNPSPHLHLKSDSHKNTTNKSQRHRSKEDTFSADHNHTLLNEIMKENRPQALITTITDRRTRTAVRHYLELWLQT